MTDIMENRKIVFEYEVMAFSELSGEDAVLVQKAMEATRRSYAPYSRFSVGAAILLSNGVTVEGANQENVAYPSGTCAERSACFYAHARYPEAAFEKIAIAARGTDGEFVAAPAVRRFSSMRCLPGNLCRYIWLGATACIACLL